MCKVKRCFADVGHLHLQDSCTNVISLIVSLALQHIREQITDIEIVPPIAEMIRVVKKETL